MVGRPNTTSCTNCVLARVAVVLVGAVSLCSGFFHGSPIQVDRPYQVLLRGQQLREGLQYHALSMHGLSGDIPLSWGRSDAVVAAKRRVSIRCQMARSKAGESFTGGLMTGTGTGADDAMVDLEGSGSSVGVSAEVDGDGGIPTMGMESELTPVEAPAATRRRGGPRKKLQDIDYTVKTEDDVCRATINIISTGDDSDLAMITPLVERLLTRYGDRIEILHRAYVPEDRPGIRLLEIWFEGFETFQLYSRFQFLKRGKRGELTPEIVDDMCNKIDFAMYMDATGDFGPML